MSEIAATVGEPGAVSLTLGDGLKETLLARADLSLSRLQSGERS